MLWLVIALLTGLILLSIPNKAYEKEPVIEYSNANDQYISKINPPPEATKNGIKDYIIQLWGENWNKAYEIMLCESGGDINAFNPEEEAKKKGITEYSSCGLFQINHPDCDNKQSRLYDWKYNIDFAYNEKYLKGGFARHWIHCSK